MFHKGEDAFHLNLAVTLRVEGQNHLDAAIGQSRCINADITAHMLFFDEHGFQHGQTFLIIPVVLKGKNGIDQTISHANRFLYISQRTEIKRISFQGLLVKILQ